MEPEFESVKRIKLGEEHRWTALVEGAEDCRWRKRVQGAQKKEVMWTPFGPSINVPEAVRACFSLSVLMRKDVRLWMFLVCPAVLFASLN